MRNSLDIFKKSKNKFILDKLRNSYFSHLWNEILSREGIPKNYLGRKGSFWYEECLSAIKKSPNLNLSIVERKSSKELQQFIWVILPRLYFLRTRKFIRKIFLNLLKK